MIAASGGTFCPCRFGSSASELREFWRAQVIDTQTWLPLDTNPSPIDARFIEVANINGHIAIAKPAIVTNPWIGTLHQGANEKIASDLAALLSICVPPVALVRSLEPWGNSVLSAFAFDQLVTWQERCELELFDGLAAAAIEQFAQAMVFHTWIFDTDHGLHSGKNVVVQLPSDEESVEWPQIAFIDHALSLSYTLPHAGALENYVVPLEDLPIDAKKAMAVRIQDLQSDEIQRIIEQIPEDFLPRALAGSTYLGLIERRNNLERLITL